MAVGRPPTGPRIVEKLEGTAVAKDRLEAVLETIAGESTVAAVCARLAICPARFYVIRDRALQAALERLEVRPGGRPRKRVSPEQARIEQLEQQAARLETELLAAETRAETALLLPRQDTTGTGTTSRAKKKPRRRAARARRLRARPRR